MNVVHTVWLTSTLGAGCFFVAGYLLSRLKGASGNRPPIQDAAAADEQAQHLRALQTMHKDAQVALKQSEVEKLSLYDRVDELQGELQRSVSSATNDAADWAQQKGLLEAELNKARAARSRAETRLHEQLRQNERELAAKQRHLDRLHAGAEQTENALRESQRVAEAERRQLQTRLREAEQQLREQRNASEHRATDSRGSGASTVASAGEPTATGPFPAVETEVRQQAMRIKLLTARVEELQRSNEQLAEAQDEIAVLQGLAKQSEELQSQMGVLQAENAALRTLAQPDEAYVSSSEPSLCSATALEAGALEAVLSRLAKDELTRSAVVGDAAGLLIAGVGEHNEEVAAVAAFLTDVGAKAARLLQPIGELHEIRLANRRQESVTVHPLVSDSGNPMILATLSNGDGPSVRTVEEALQSAKDSMAVSPPA